MHGMRRERMQRMRILDTGNSYKKLKKKWLCLEKKVVVVRRYSAGTEN